MCFANAYFNPRDKSALFIVISYHGDFKAPITPLENLKSQDLFSKGGERIPLIICLFSIVSSARVRERHEIER